MSAVLSNWLVLHHCRRTQEFNLEGTSPSAWVFFLGAEGGCLYELLFPFVCIYYKFSRYVQCVEHRTIVAILSFLFPTVLYRLLEFLIWRK